ncbi:RBP11-like subunits of RNA polymerase [Lentithecium fluviatile CBS 122367]|uniref:DNA-directed RNA polymerases I and III subunit RPAC2 n=1 Tax=Lentithecium fluviatile CBS 122367 TaxID=1168545 RepID=A0A6G1INR1_9PLEO|nr:RBP11-like subunits of RNA polymerase [Lentithecium fluviatile CBS 122367]
MAAPEDPSHIQIADTSADPDDTSTNDPSNITNRVTRLSGSTDTAASFQIEKEDHTLGNALRYIIMKNPDVEFCGYSIPHPSEDKMNIRIQTYDNVSAESVLDKALQDLMDMCDVIEEKFREAREEHQNKMEE